MIEGVETLMLGKFKNLVDMQEQSCTKFRDREFLGTKGPDGYTWITYKEFGEMVSQLRGGLASLGVGPGDKVAAICKNSVEWVVGAYATYGLRALYVPLYETQNLRTWQYILRDSQSKVLLAGNNNIYRQTVELTNEIETLKHVVNLEGSTNDPKSYISLLKIGKQRPVPSQQPGANEPMGLIYTSGTTGNPKGVLLSHGNVISNVNAIHEIFVDIGPDDRSLSFLPWAHSFGQTCELHMLMSCGGSMGFAENMTTILEDLAIVKPTILISVPRIFERIYERVNKTMQDKGGLARAIFKKGMERANERRQHSGSLGGFGKMTLSLADKIVFKKIRERFGGRLRFAVSGGSSLSKDIAEFIDNLNITVYEGYGLSETSPIVACNFKSNQRLGSVGKPIPGVRVEIDKSVVGESSKVGEITVYGPNVMLGYYNRPEDTRATMTADGGLRTGDLGYFDSEGYLFITGRIKEQYQLAIGKMVSPAPLEENLKLSPFINQVMLYGEGKMYNVALIVPEREALKEYADSRDIKAVGRELLSDPRIQELFKQELEHYSNNFESYEKPKKFALIADEWSVDTGVLTPTLKLKRRVILDTYKNVIDSLYT